MRSPTQLCLAIEDISDLLALPAVWAEKCGSEDFAYIERFLSPTKDRAARYPCPHPAGYNCPRLIVGDDGGPFEALCQDPHKICPDLALSLKDALLHELDLVGLIEPMLKVAGIRNPELEPRAPGIWNAGLAIGGDLVLQPAYLLVFAGAEEFARAAMSLAYEVDGPFTIVAPTGRHWTGTLREKLRPPRNTFVALSERVALDDAGEFVAVRPLPPCEVAKDLVKRAAKKRGRPVAAQTQEIVAAWIDMGSPTLNAMVCDKLAREAYPSEWKSVRVGGKLHKRLRDRVGNTVRRGRKQLAMKSIS